MKTKMSRIEVSIHLFALVFIGFVFGGTSVSDDLLQLTFNVSGLTVIIGTIGTSLTLIKKRIDRGWSGQKQNEDRTDEGYEIQETLSKAVKWTSAIWLILFVSGLLPTISQHL